MKRRDVKLDELQAILERARQVLAPDDHATLSAAVDTLALLTRELEAQTTLIERLRRLVLGASTETTRKVLGDTKPAARSKDASATKPKGHGRNGAAAYRGAQRIAVPHASLQPGDRCPACTRGKVYRQGDPATLLRIQGMAPLQATVYELERLRCNLCGDVFSAAPPEGVGPEKYDATATSMIGLLKYGCGLPFARLERLQDPLGIPLPAQTQWDAVNSASISLQPAYDELIRQAAQGEVLYHDDTAMKILQLQRSPEHAERTGVFTSGIVSTTEGRSIALFFTGPQHAGENLRDLLARRQSERAPPIQMCDALSRNTSEEFETILAHCLAHGRRHFVDIAANFPEECRFVLETLRDVYRHDATTRERGLSPQERHAFHQEHSQPLMDQLQAWCREQFAQRTVEPNSSLGKAITYLNNHWTALTLFLRQPGAPLENNICERALKKAILNRKNAYFYRTEKGAKVGDLFMSLIHSAELNHADPFDYLVQLQRHASAVRVNPDQWMPWNYRDALPCPAPPP